jgi:hypothetical protein
MSDTTADELEIRNLVARYSDAVNRRDSGDWGATWAKQGEWHLMGNATQGRETIVAHWENLMTNFPFVMQLVHSGAVEVQGDTGTGRWYLTEINRTDNGAGSAIGVYHDRYLREDGVWTFARRRFDVLYMGPPDLSGQLLPFPSEI